MPNPRLTIDLRPNIVGKLKALVSRTHQNQTDVVNKAIQLYEFIDGQQRKGREIVIKDSKGNEQTITFL